MSGRLSSSRVQMQAQPSFGPNLVTLNTATHGRFGAEQRAWLDRAATPATLLALIGLSIAFFWRAIGLHQVLLPADILYAKDPLWSGLSPHGFTTPANPLDSDALTEFYPWTVLASQSLHHGTIPLWNPYAFAGTPFLAAMQTAIFYPVNLILEWLLAPANLLGVRAVVHLVLTLTGVFVLARRLQFSRPAAVLSALAFGFGLPNVVWLEHPMAGAIAWLPWLLLCADGIITSHDRVRWIVAGAAMVALELLAGHGESSVHAFLLCGAYSVARSIRMGSQERDMVVIVRLLTALLAALAIGIGIAAVQALPSLVQIAHSEAAADRASLAPVGILGEPVLWKTLATALVPDLFGNPTWHATLLPAGIGYNEATLYVGTAPLFLAFVAIIRRRDAHTMFFALVAIVALGIAMYLPLIGLLDNLPGLRLAANGRLRIEYAFAIAMLAGLGLDALCRTATLATARRLTRLWWLTIAAIAAIGLPNLLTTPIDGIVLPAAHVATAALPLLWISLVAVLLWMVQRELLPMATACWSLVALTAVDLFALGVGYHTTVPSAQVAVVPPAIQVISADRSLYRVAGLGTALLPSLSSLYGLQDIRGYDPAYDASYERYFQASFSAPGGMRLGLPPFGPSPAAARALDLLNVKYLIAACSISLNERYYQLVYRGNGCVYRNSTVMPRAMLVHRIGWASPAMATQLLGTGTVDPRRTALLDPATTTARDWHTTPNTGSDTVQVTRYESDLVALTVRSAAGGTLVLADTYAPGWAVRVDSSAVPLARADAILRAVPVPAGKHMVEFRYTPSVFGVGAQISAAALVLWLLLAGYAVLRRGQARRSSEASGRLLHDRQLPVTVTS